MDEITAMQRAAFMQSLIESIMRETGVSRARDAPADDPAGIGVDDEGVDDEGDVTKPDKVEAKVKSETESRLGAGA